MNIECSIALDTLSIVYMLVLIIMMKQKNKRETLNCLYCLTAVAICVFLALDMLYYILYGSQDKSVQDILKTVKSLYFIVNSAIVWLWAKYIDHTVFGDDYKEQKHRYVYAAVFAVNTAAVILNYFSNFLFDISDKGTFVVEPAAMWTFSALNYFSIVLTSVILIVNRRKLKKNIFLPLLIFPIPPLLAEVVQIFYRPCSFLCTYAVSVLIVFQISQNNTMYTDELTGLANRRLLNETLRKWLLAPKGLKICGIMIDLDDLKNINDTYGHLSGDNALITVADIMKGIKRKSMVSARYGGDEFIMIWLSRDGNDIAEVEKKLQTLKKRANESKPKRERIDFSLGSYCCSDSDYITADCFIKQIDDKMYQVKKEKTKSKNGEM